MPTNEKYDPDTLI